MNREFEPVTDLGPVRWVRDALPEWDNFLPGYDAYVAILHPSPIEAILADPKLEAVRVDPRRTS
jgi:hypothetical protein